jgi:hypothetical protein
LRRIFPVRRPQGKRRRRRDFDLRVINSDEIDSISSEIAELESLLAQLPTENVIERVGFESRLQSVRALMASAEFSCEKQSIESGQEIMDIVTNVVFVIPNVEDFDDVGDIPEFIAWPIGTLWEFYQKFTLDELAELDCSDWRAVGIPDYVVTHATEELVRRVSAEMDRNPSAYVTQPIRMGSSTYEYLKCYNQLIDEL